MSDLIRDEKLAVYAGDCYFEDMESVLNEERHFTVSFYLRCIACDSFYFFGDCIRGKPIYRKIDDISSEKIDKKLWGYRGEYFYSERNGD